MGHFVFQPPIDAPNNNKIEPSYPYGSTQNGAREPHHGVEFINPQGTPVLAVGDGVVVFAGNDSNVEIGWWVKFYGNLVVIQHSIEGFDAPIFSLYGHLSKILVKQGDAVKAGRQIGEVGMTGKALGTHLHFEVREGKNDYAHTRNPELWLLPENENGALVGQIFNEAGEVRRYPDFKLISLDHPEMVVPQPRPYADSALNGDDNYKEVFAVGNLQPGKYELHFSPNGKTQITQFEIFPKLVTRITYHTQY
jgi:murein DD-endopeptidase MepM/ murein hydrolase activator NlpD